MAIYPPVILDACREACSGRVRSNENAIGRAASFTCGCFAAIGLSINDGKHVEGVSFRTNGCGYMLAAATRLAGQIDGRDLTDLHGLASKELLQLVETSFGNLPSNRQQCCEVAIEALHNAFADFRSSLIEEFSGEKALICTCFGVTEETIEKFIASEPSTNIEDVTNACRAGGGCGSCRMLIQEIIDSRNLP